MVLGNQKSGWIARRISEPIASETAPTILKFHLLNRKERVVKNLFLNVEQPREANQLTAKQMWQQVKLKDGSIENGLIQSIGEARGNSRRGKDSETYGNRIQYCLVISPAGRPLRAYKVVKELLEPLGDAIFGHKSLVEDGKILHGDVSENNIIITESATDGDPKGSLTDLEVVKELDSVRSGADY